MTNDDFLAYKYTIKTKAADMAMDVYSNARLGKDTKDNDFIRLKALLIYSKIINEYVLSIDDDQNMFTRDEMSSVTNHINKLCDTNFNINLILDD